MRKKLFVTLGKPGSGKENFFNKYNQYLPYIISKKNLRLMFSAPVQTITGGQALSEVKEKFVQETFENMIDNRLANGEFTIILDSHLKLRHWNKYLKLCKKHRADLICVDFRNYEENTITNTYDFEKKFNEEELFNMEKQENSLILPSSIEVIKPSELNEFIKIKPLNLNDYKEIVHFGDIHGCIYPLSDYFKENPYSSEKFYIFCGDYIDRGLNNYEVLRYLKELSYKPNVILLTGNHELHLINYVNDNTIKSFEFKEFTLKELHSKGFSKKQAFQFTQSLKEYIYYEYEGKKVFVTHGGIAKIPKTLLDMPTIQFIKGVGGYDFDVDNYFYEDENIYQVHGHRNTFKHNIFAGSHSFNLEGAVESGHNLRVLSLSNNYFTPLKIKNNIYSVRFESNKVTH